MAHHLTEPNERAFEQTHFDTRLLMRYTIHLGTEFDLTSNSLFTLPKVKVFLLVFYFLKQGEFTQINLGLYYKSGNYVIGFWYRNRDSFILTLG